MKKLKAAIILDNLKITAWQKDALTEALELLDIKFILNCQNTKTKKDISKHSFYYALNVFALKNNKLTKKIEYETLGVEVLNFNSLYSGNWQSLPTDITKTLIDNNIEVVIKFGMSLLTVDNQLAEIPILSYHHGNPSKYRGRPAGFYEIMNNEDNTGIIVQQISNKLDGGRVLAYAESKIERYSYKKTAENFYKQSRFLLKKALINLQRDSSHNLSPTGKNYTLPDNSTVTNFSISLIKNKLNRLKYGALYEKRWKVGLVSQTLDLRSSNVIDASSIKSLPIKKEYNFYADPFFSADGSKIRLEALGNKSGIGDIIEVDVDEPENIKVLLTGRHYSYPFSFLIGKNEHLLPEVASHSPQYHFNLEDGNQEHIYLKGLESKRLVDSTLFEHEGYYYLFFGEGTAASTTLNLWVSKSIDGTFEEHPSSPICLTPSSARMAGRIYNDGSSLYRFGQNNNRGYGESITISEITKLTPETYEETVCGSIKLDGLLGPHTIDINDKDSLILIDYYDDRFSVFSGLRRFKAKIFRE